jgi:hypothetical protein
MSYIQTGLGLAFLVSLVLLFLSYNPNDEFNTWAMFAVGVAFTSTGYLIATIFDNSFVFDPSPENWRRKTDPRD